MKLEIRLEEKNDYRKVKELTREAFWNIYVPGANEHFIIHSLRSSEIAVPELNLVAVKDGEIIGQIFYTKAEIVAKDGMHHDVLTFGPLSVDPKYYNKVGFQSAAKFGIARADGVFAKALLAMELYPGSLDGISGNFHEFISALTVDENKFSEFDASFPEKEKKHEPSQDLFLEI